MCLTSVKISAIINKLICGDAGIGRQASLRCLCQYWRVGSSPISRTSVKDIRYFECPLFLYPAKKRKLKYIYMQNLFIFNLQFNFTYFRSKSTVIILSVPIIGLITQYIDKLLSNGCCKYVFKYNNSNRNNSFLLAIITFKCYNTH